MWRAAVPVWALWALRAQSALWALRAPLSLLLVASGALAAAPDAPVPREVIVHFSDGSLAHAAGVGRRVRPGASVVAVDGDDRADHNTDRAEKSRRLRQAMEHWRSRPGVRLVEPNVTGHFEAVPDAAPPDDPQFASQWWLRTVGVLGLWPIGQGRGIKVALVDSGVSLAHPDLAANLEGDGYNFGDNNADPGDALGHGTGVAGIIAAVANNGVGIAGLAPAVRLLPIKVSAADSTAFSASSVAQAVDYAVARGARVINLSLVFDQSTELLRQAIQSALDRGIAVIVAAGNSAGPVAFPATMPGVIAVAATDRQGGLYVTSNRGPEIVIAAPGADILTTTLGAGYVNRSGTSFAAPMVAGAMAALMSINPSVPAATLVSLLRAAATPVVGQSSGQSSSQPFGQLQAGLAAASLLPAITLTSGTGTSGTGTSQRSFEVGYRMPPFGAPADLYVAVTTPVGEFILLPDCTWAGVPVAGYRPAARGYSAAASASGVLFGQGGICSPAPLAGLPAGAYNWRIAATDTAAGTLIGAVNGEAMEIAP
jgi:thermitase